MSRKVIIKVSAWIAFIGSGGYLAVHFGEVVAIVILINFSSFYMISWIDDKEKGRLR